MIEKEIHLGELTLHYKQFEAKASKGNVVILHGWGGKSDSWVNVGKILKQNGYSVIIPDLPGFGKTKISKTYTLDMYAAIIEEMIGELKLENTVLIGHSNGGAISTKIVSREKIKIHKLILNNSAGVRANLKRRIKRMIMKPFVIAFKIFSFLPFSSIVRRGVYKIIGGGDYLAAEKQNPHFKATYLNMISSDLTQDFHKIRIPTLLIWGEKDTFTPVADGSYIRLNIKDSEYTVIPDQPHSIHLSNPIELSKNILDYLKT